MKASEILALFVAKQDPREFIRKPIRENGYLYATNGAIAIRCADDNEITDVADIGDWNIPERIDALVSAADYEEVVFKPLVFKDSKVECRSCNGLGRVTTCEACEDGIFEHYGHHYECRSCNAMGYVPGKAGDIECPECYGDKFTFDNVRVDGRLFNGDYLDRLSRLPDIQIHVSIDESAASIFKFTGGIGVIMPMRG